MRTERLTILLAPEERAAIDAKASRMGLTASEFLRLAAEAFDESQTEALLFGLAEQIEEAVTAANKRLDETHRLVSSTLADMKREREERGAAERPKAA